MHPKSRFYDGAWLFKNASVQSNISLNGWNQKLRSNCRVNFRVYHQSIYSGAARVNGPESARLTPITWSDWGTLSQCRRTSRRLSNIKTVRSYLYVSPRKLRHRSLNPFLQYVELEAIARSHCGCRPYKKHLIRSNLSPLAGRGRATMQYKCTMYLLQSRCHTQCMEIPHAWAPQESVFVAIEFLKAYI